MILICSLSKNSSFAYKAVVGVKIVGFTDVAPNTTKDMTVGDYYFLFEKEK